MKFSFRTEVDRSRFTVGLIWGTHGTMVRHWRTLVIVLPFISFRVAVEFPTPAARYR